MRDWSIPYTMASYLREGAECQTPLDPRPLAGRNLNSKARTIFIGSTISTLREKMQTCGWQHLTQDS